MFFHTAPRYNETPIVDPAISTRDNSLDDLINLKQSLSYKNKNNLVLPIGNSNSDNRKNNRKRKSNCPIKVVQAKDIRETVINTNISVNSIVKRPKIHIQEDSSTSEEYEEKTFEEYRSMPLSLNNLYDIQSYQPTPPESLAKPKKIWMQKLLNYDSDESDESDDDEYAEEECTTQNGDCSDEKEEVKSEENEKYDDVIEKEEEKEKNSENTNIVPLEPNIQKQDFVNSNSSVPLMYKVKMSSINKVILTLDRNSKDNFNNKDADSISYTNHIKTDDAVTTDEVVSFPSDNGDYFQKVETSSSDASNKIIKESDSAKIDEKSPKFQIGDVVWAKITGYPFWPGKIGSFDKNFKAKVEWYAWKEISYIRVASLYRFVEAFNDKYQRKNRNSKYQEAVKLAKLDAGLILNDDNSPTNPLQPHSNTEV